MNFRRLIPLLPLAVSALFGTPSAYAQTGTPSLKVPRLNFQTRVLPNGLTVYSLENHASPTVAIQVWYKVGSKNDPVGRSGFAHLFEHIMFKSTRNMKAETMDRLTEDVGGENNAFTQSDVTVYHETVPSNYLQTLLWAEADRMANLKVDDANFKSERLVVEEEFRSSVLAEPYGRLYELLVPELSYTKPAFHRSTIGSISDLDSSTLDDVRKFHDTYYRPDNAVLVVVGDFDARQMNGWVDQYFGRIAKPATAIPRADETEPLRTVPHAFNETAPNVPLPALTLTYLTPGVSSADAPALRMADSILSGGESSRLYRSLVYGQRVASEVSTGADLHASVGLFTAQVVAASGKSLDAVRTSLLAEIAKIKAVPPTIAELTRARNQLLTGALEGRETDDGIASSLGDAAVLQGDPELVNTDIERLARVTSADIQRVARKYFTDANRVEIRYANGPDSSGIKPSTAPAVATMPSLMGATETAQMEGAVETPPAPSAPRPVAFPTPVEKTLANGLRVIVIRKAGTGLVTADLELKQAGAVTEPDQDAGLAEFTSGLLTRGTATRSATQIASAIETLGTSISAGAGWDSASVGVTVLKTNLAPALNLMADVTLHPAFSPSEITRLREEKLDDLQVSLQSPGTIARLAASRIVFGSTPYGHPLGGTPTTLKALTRGELSSFHARRYVPGNAVLVFGGDIRPEEAFALAQNTFGGWRASAASGGAEDTMSAFGRLGGLLVVDKPDAGQAAVVISEPAIARDSPDYYVGTVTNAVLGGGYSARLNEEVRIKRGLSYGAGSSLSARRAIGPFAATAQTKNPSAGQVAQLMLDELGRLATEPVPDGERMARVASLSGGYARQLETGGGLAGQIGTLAVYDRPLTDLSDYLPRIQAVTASQIQQFATSNLSAAKADIVIVGDSKQFLPDLKTRVPRPVTVIPSANLNLDKPIIAAPDK